MIICYTVPVKWHVTDVIVFHFGLFFAFYLPNNLKNGNFKKMKERKKKMPGDIILHKCGKNHDHMLYCSWDMACDGCNCFFSFWAFFALLPPNSPNYQKLKTMRKTPGDIIILHMYQEWWLDDVQFLRYGAQQMGRQTNRQTDGWWSDI